MYGTAAWEEPETIEEAKARMGELLATPAPDEVRELVAEVRRLRSEREEIRRAAQRLVSTCPRPDNEETQRIRDEAIDTLAGRTPVDDDWLERAVEEIGRLDVHEGHVDLAKALAILRMHRDAKA